MPFDGLQCDYTRTLTLPPATPVTVDVGINFATNWVAVVQNVGDNEVTGISIATLPLGGIAEPLVVLTEALPLAAGLAYPGIRGCQEPVLKLRMVFVSPGGTIITINASGR